MNFRSKGMDHADAAFRADEAEKRHRRGKRPPVVDREQKLIDVLQEVREYFDQRADAETQHGDSGPHPNEEMKMLVLIDEVLGRQADGR